MTERGIISLVQTTNEGNIIRDTNSMVDTFLAVFPAQAVFYTSIPVLDSTNNTAPWVNLGESYDPWGIQLFRCSLSLVEQTAILDAQSRNLTSIGPTINKTASTWLPFTGHSNNLSDVAFRNPQGFLDIVRHQ
jgi:hypothetical protein